MPLILVIVCLAGLVASLPAAAQDFEWVVADSIGPAVEDARAFDIACADEDHCLYCGTAVRTFDPYWAYSFVRFTTDGGTTWRTVEIDTSYVGNPYEVPRPQRVAHPAPHLMMMAADSGYLYRSDDGGRSWTTMHIGVGSASLSSLEMFDAATGVVVSGSEGLLRTVDSGRSWQPLIPPDSLREYGYDYAFPAGAQSVVLRLARPDDVRIARTDDEGRNWRVSGGPWSAGRLNFADSLHGWAVGLERDSGSWFTGKDVIARTTDGGSTWHDQIRSYVDPPLGIANVDFLDSRHGIAGGGLGKLIVTEDGGEHWSRIPVDPDRITGIWGVAYPSRNRAFALGGNAAVLRLDRKSASAGAVRMEESGPDVTLAGGALIIRMGGMTVQRLAVSLYSTTGVRVARIESDVRDGRTEVPMAGFASGLYLVTVETADGATVTDKIVLVK